VANDLGEVFRRKRLAVVEVRVVEDRCHLLGVRDCDRSQSVVEGAPQIVPVDFQHVLPEAALRDQDRVVGGRIRVDDRARLRNVAEIGESRLGLLRIQIARPLEEEQREHVVALDLDVGQAAEEIRGRPQVILELAEGERGRW
jgi:hypothetical protein